MKKLSVKKLVLGMVATNCYLVKNTETDELLLIDPADAPERIAEEVRRFGGTPVAVLLTHGHFDHIGAADALRRRYGIPVCALEQEQQILENVDKNLSLMSGRGFTVSADRYFQDGETAELAGVSVRVLHTPGHTAGGACYYIPEEQMLFSGDTLFCGSIGRTDFPTGSMSELRRAVHEKLFVLPDTTCVYPGHDAQTDIGYEKQNNPFLI